VNQAQIHPGCTGWVIQLGLSPKSCFATQPACNYAQPGWIALCAPSGIMVPKDALRLAFSFCADEFQNKATVSPGAGVWRRQRPGPTVLRLWAGLTHQARGGKAEFLFSETLPNEYISPSLTGEPEWWKAF
jgi:hypothetical protein